MSRIILVFSFCALLSSCATQSPTQIANPYINIAEQFADEQEWLQSINALNKALEINPKDAYALVNRGKAKLNAGFPIDEVLTDTNASLSIRKTAKGYLQRCHLREEMKLYADAIEDCNQAMRYANAKGVNPDTIEKLKASGLTGNVSLGGDFDRAYRRIRKQALESRSRIGDLMGDGPELQALQLTPHFIAASYGYLQWTPLYLAASRGLTEIVKVMLASNANVDGQENWNSWTPLCVAAENGHIDIVSLLLEAGADVNIKNNSSTPLIKAVENGHYEVVKILLAANADINRQSGIQNTPLMAAAYKGHTKIALALLAANADVNYVVMRKSSALTEAASEGHNDIVVALLAANADVNGSLKQFGWTPLLRAIANGHVLVVKTLLAHNADITLKVHSFGGEITAIELAKKLEHSDIIKLLAER